jgi:hypothetical protein
MVDERAGRSFFPCSKVPVFVRRLREVMGLRLSVTSVAGDGSEVGGVTGVVQDLQLQPSTKPIKMLLYRRLEAGQVEELPCVGNGAGTVAEDLPEGLMGPVYECRYESCRYAGFIRQVASANQGPTSQKRADVRLVLLHSRVLARTP